MKDTKPNALLFMGVITCPVCGTTFHRTRSEEHTSELQSH